MDVAFRVVQDEAEDRAHSLAADPESPGDLCWLHALEAHVDDCPLTAGGSEVDGMPLVGQGQPAFRVNGWSRGDGITWSCQWYWRVPFVLLMCLVSPAYMCGGVLTWLKCHAILSIDSHTKSSQGGSDVHDVSRGFEGFLGWSFAAAFSFRSGGDELQACG